MRRLTATRVAVTVLLVGAGVPTAMVPAGATTTGPMASSASTLYVANQAACSDAGQGSAAQPFCTVSAAAAVVAPGQTVRVEPGSYHEQLRISRSGTDAAPITFVAENTAQGMVRVFSDTASVPAVSVSGVRNVTLRGFTAFAGSGADAFRVSDSYLVAIEQGSAHGNAAGVRVTGSSSTVSVRQVSVVDRGPAAIQVDAGVSGTSVTASTITALSGSGRAATGVLATDAPGTTVTGNTVIAPCGQGIALAGASVGSSIENNIVENAGGSPKAPAACPAPFTSTAISVSADSADSTGVDYNLVDPTGGGAPYNWSGTVYPTPAALTAATGQGAHELSAAPQLTDAVGGDISWYPLASTSPAIDSADADARGALAVDYLGAPHQDVPAVPNTGAGKTAYADRGAVEFAAAAASSGSPRIVQAPGGGALEVEASVPGAGYPGAPYGATGASFAYQFDDEPFPVVTTEGTVRHTFQRAGYHGVRIAVSTDGFRTGTGVSFPDGGVVVGADYTPVAPTRLLDTRNRIGTPTTTPVAPGGDLLLPITSVDGTPAAELTAVTVNVTVTEPTGTGFLTVYPDGRSLPNASNLNFTPGQTVPNLVTVPVEGGGIRFHNTGSGTVHVIADLAGYYSNKGYGFKPLAPTRVLDTRSGLGASAARPMAVGEYLRVNLSDRIPAGAKAAVLNVTVTEPQDTGFLTAFPDGQLLPNASSLNFTPGLTVANLVTVPVSNGRIDLHNSSFGTVHVVADLAGYYGTPDSGATLSYIPQSPVRVADTRDGTGLNRSAGAVAPQDGISIYPSLPLGDKWPVSVLFNVTVTEPRDTGFLTAYPDGRTRPTASNLNFTPGRTVPNLVSVPVADGRVRIDNGSFGPVQIVVDEQGYFIDPTH
ncbi:right-handed parallel beta-helix repeat-containing protein [Kitasatospora sp. NPDC049285]|uniref:right-handed parallel beta-helix repeat-containing protein n=1 Tax=Kitasatospora sp. NPDC049285 TaxID=3157096 RepID=UPI00343D3D90